MSWSLDYCAAPPVVSRSELPDGDDGVAATLDAMEWVVAWSVRDPESRRLLDRAAARIIGSPVPAPARAQRLRSWARRWFRFEPDPPGQELVKAPAIQLCELDRAGVVWGDCDDLAVLAAALGRVAGLPPRFVVVAMQGPDFEHVWTELHDGTRWVDFDLVAEIQGYTPGGVGAQRRAARNLAT